MLDQETLYQYVYNRDWLGVLDMVHQYAPDVRADDLLSGAVETFLHTFFDDVMPEDPDAHALVLEKLFLLHTGAIYPLPSARFVQVVEALVSLNADDLDVARGYAQFCPESAHCQSILKTAGETQITHEDANVRVTSKQPQAADHTVSLFRSRQEVAFFMAVRDVFATYFVYPNVGLSSLIDYEAIREQLSASERAYFFTAVVDSVVFDQHNDYRPRYFFELDSPLHDLPQQRERDRMKDHIIALAGQRLYRVMPRQKNPSKEHFIDLLRGLEAIEA